MATTKHYNSYRTMRQMLINSIGYGFPMLTITNIDRGHKNGTERHTVTSTGIIEIYNENTNNLVTVLIARPAQIQRYYTMIGGKAPAWLMEIAREHQRNGYNN